MDTAQIVRQCRRLPGVTVREGEDYTELLLSGSEGSGRMRFIPLFAGVTLALISVNAPSWPAPAPESSAPEAKGPLIVNYCTRSRCELMLNDNKSVFLTAGHISLTEKFALNEYVYPGRVYEGIELFIDPETVRHGLPVLREGFGVELAALREKYCPDGETYIARLPLPDTLSGRLSDNAGAESAMGTVQLKTGVIDLLALLLHDQSQPRQPVYYTRSQVAIAKQIEAIITGDLSQPHTVREFAERFSVSESSVKNYFHGVYGQSIAQYMTGQRMLLAAKLLAQTKLSVIDMAARVGYLNQSKFSAAFRLAYACTPLEYRRSQRLSGDKVMKKQEVSDDV